MISEEMLAAAAGEVSAAMISSITECPHTFSPGFERKLRSLIRRAAHPVRWQVLRHAAAILIAVSTIFGALYLLSPMVRATVNGWVRSTFGSYFQYHTNVTARPDVEYDYFLPEEFDGYTLLTEIVKGENKLYIYSNTKGEMLSFEYLRGTSNSSIFLTNIENCTYYSSTVNFLSADIYIAPTEDDISVIVWHDPSENVLFCIGACQNKDQLIAIAEKVEKIEKNKN